MNVDINYMHSLQKEYLGTTKAINNLTPLVSVCISTYQHAKYIGQCLDGILMQKTNFLFEIVLGKDESTDRTRQICIKYAEKFPDKIKLYLRDRKLTALYVGVSIRFLLEGR